MFSPSGSIRLWMTAALLLGAFFLLRSVSHGEPVLPHQPLRDLPYTIGSWTGQESPLSDRIVQAVSVSDYTNRFYYSVGSSPIQLYVGFYGSQETGDTIHSPKNCLPGAGWDPVHAGFATIPVAGRQITVNEYVVQQDQDKELVFYWYQGRGRVIASEYAGKFWMVADAISRNRTDGALVRLNTPITENESTARARLVGFTQELFPKLDELIPK
ncbi:MAG: exosortase C-terminal domain/associated protein EpsI [Candidatus Acidiferrales bacterium]